MSTTWARRGRARDGAPGFTLLEVLIALLVLSIGLLGVARLEILSMRSNHSSFLRGQAVGLAYDMADRLRANRRAIASASGASVGYYDAADPATYMVPANHGCSQTNNTLASQCSVSEMAAHDLFEWQQMIATMLPAGAGITCRDSTPDDGAPGTPDCDGSGDRYAVKVWWTDLDFGGPTDKRFVLGLRP